MNLPTALTLIGLLILPTRASALAMTNESLDGTYNKEPPGLVSRVGKMPLAAGGGLLSGLMLFWLWEKKRRSARNAGMVLMTILLAAGGGTAEACANIESGTLEDSYAKNLDSLDWFSKPVERALASKASDDPHIIPNPEAYPSEPPPGIRENDEAVRMILRGNARAALRTLKEIEIEHPGLYATAANLGTCYELTGDDEQALQWIEEGLRRNPYSHMLAEWLHVRVLQAKLALKSDPSWLRSHTICRFNPEDHEFLTEQGLKDTEGLLASFRSQCTVRALFLKPEDPIMAQLLYEAATFMLEDHSYSVDSTLALAVKYGLPQEKAEALQEKAADFLKGKSVGRPGGLSVWLARQKYELVFLLSLSLGFLIPVSFVLKRENAPRFRR